jgi:hypothetical protein
MSELRSLFVKLKIRKENLDRFLEAELTTPVLDENWTSWWESRKMYSKSPLTELPMDAEETNGEVFGSYVDTEETLSKSKYEDGVYYFVSALFGENYYEILPMLAVLKSAALYMEPGDEGEAFIFDYFWGGKDVLAHVELKPKQGLLTDIQSTTKIKKPLLQEADKWLEELVKRLTDRHRE